MPHVMASCTARTGLTGNLFLQIVGIPNTVSFDGVPFLLHPALQQFLDNYPSAPDEIQANPGNYVVPLLGSTWNRSLFRDAGD